MQNNNYYCLYYIKIYNLDSDDIKRKMYSSILVVGGGLKFEGACAWLKSKISLNAQQVYYGGLFCTLEHNNWLTFLNQWIFYFRTHWNNQFS